MRHRKLLAGIAVGSLAALGGFGFAHGPGNSNADTPDEAENGCSGIEEAQERVGEDSPAGDILEEVEELLAGEDGCDDGPASERRDGNSENRP